MQVKILLKQNLMPRFYRNHALSFVKECIRKGNEKVYTDFYKTEKVLKKKPFSFEVFFKGNRIGDMYLVEKNPVLTFSTDNAEILNAFLKGISVLSDTGYEFYVSEHLKDIAKPKILRIDKKLASNTLRFANFLLPESAENFRKKTKDMNLEKKIRFYFESQGLIVKKIYHLKQKKPVFHKFRNAVLKVNPVELAIKIEAESKEKLLEVVYNGLGWFSSEGFGYCNSVVKKAKNKAIEKTIKQQ